MKDSSKAVSWDNQKAFVEVKFKDDKLTRNQQKAKKLAAKSKFKVIEENDCKCT
jgi:hypothetical protein